MIYIREEAKLDVLAGAVQYARISLNYGGLFIDSIDSKVRSIEQFPESCPIKIKNYRRAIISNFPYSIYYRIDKQNDIIIVAVLHNKTGLRNILRRIQEL